MPHRGLSRWQAYLLAVFLCRRLSARLWACVIHLTTLALRLTLRRTLPHPPQRQNRGGHVNTSARNGNTVPHAPPRGIPGRCPACNQTLSPLFRQNLRASFHKTVSFIGAAARPCARGPVWYSLSVPLFCSPNRGNVYSTSLALINSLKK